MKLNASEKAVVLSKAKRRQILDRLITLCFTPYERFKYANPDVDGNIQRVSLAHDRIDESRWFVLVVETRKPAEVELDLQALGLCQATDIISDQQTRHTLEQDLLLAKDYWLQRIQRYVESGSLRDEELYIALDAHKRLRHAADLAADWNLFAASTNRVPVEAFPNFNSPVFRETKPLSKDANLKPEVLAAIMSGRANDCVPRLSPVEAARQANESLTAAKRYIESLPEQKTAAEIQTDLYLYFREVTFAEIQASSQDAAEQRGESLPGRLPLLTPEPPERNSGRLSLRAIEAAVVNYFAEEKNRGVALEEAEWKDIKQSCLQNRQIPLHLLCDLRWQRYKDFRQGQITRGLKHRNKSRPPKPQPTQAATKVPKSAGTSPTFAGKPGKKKPPAKWRK